jgi:hypothetical protein
VKQTAEFVNDVQHTFGDKAIDAAGIAKVAQSGDQVALQKKLKAEAAHLKKEVAEMGHNPTNAGKQTTCLNEFWAGIFRKVGSGPRDLSKVCNTREQWDFKGIPLCVASGTSTESCTSSKSGGHCAGGDTFGSAEQQATAVLAALKSNMQHPACKEKPSARRDERGEAFRAKLRDATDKWKQLDKAIEGMHGKIAKAEEDEKRHNEKHGERISLLQVKANAGADCNTGTEGKAMDGTCVEGFKAKSDIMEDDLTKLMLWIPAVMSITAVAHQIIGDDAPGVGWQYDTVEEARDIVNPLVPITKMAGSLPWVGGLFKGANLVLKKANKG